VTPFLAAAIAEMLPSADPSGCRECGFDWSISGDDALVAIDQAPDRFASLLDGDQAATMSEAGGWSPAAYVWHAGDVTRAWSERLHTLRHDPSARWGGFDPDELAAARNYRELPAVTAPWALANAVHALVGVVDGADLGTGFEHPEWGHGTVADALRWVAHELVHHQLDVGRTLGHEAR
jgi:hypothetical protein